MRLRRGLSAYAKHGVAEQLERIPGGFAAEARMGLPACHVFHHDGFNGQTSFDAMGSNPYFLSILKLKLRPPWTLERVRHGVR